jgi:hypothetical protein
VVACSRKTPVPHPTRPFSRVKWSIETLGARKLHAFEHILPLIPERGGYCGEGRVQSSLASRVRRSEGGTGVSVIYSVLWMDSSRATTSFALKAAMQVHSCWEGSYRCRGSTHQARRGICCIIRMAPERRRCRCLAAWDVLFRTGAEEIAAQPGSSGSPNTRLSSIDATVVALDEEGGEAVTVGSYTHTSVENQKTSVRTKTLACVVQVTYSTLRIELTNALGWR